MKNEGFIIIYSTHGEVEQVIISISDIEKAIMLFLKYIDSEYKFKDTKHVSWNHIETLNVLLDLYYDLRILNIYEIKKTWFEGD